MFYIVFWMGLIDLTDMDQLLIWPELIDLNSLGFTLISLEKSLDWFDWLDLTLI